MSVHPREYKDAPRAVKDMMGDFFAIERDGCGPSFPPNRLCVLGPWSLVLGAWHAALMAWLRCAGGSWCRCRASTP